LLSQPYETGVQSLCHMRHASLPLARQRSADTQTTRIECNFHALQYLPHAARFSLVLFIVNAQKMPRKKESPRALLGLRRGSSVNPDWH
jgi:hypothetical protein